ncbi:MAG: sugar ABC transporter permease [Actinobacteria bacterium HGW-Actinobacteria-4]|nr:MAG: sugar ABC transporter permease [Actinobacteria bacterium HGW-Actinobacteria-4]
MRSRLLTRGLLVALLILGALAMVFPFVWTLITSLTSGAGLSATPSLIPEDPSLDAYFTLFGTTNFGRAVLNSVGLAVIITFLQVATSALAAYGFARFDFPGKRVMFAVYLATMMIPIQVLIVPLFTQMRDMGLINSYWGVILPSTASAFGVFLLRQAIATVPREFDEAATIDGAGRVRIFTTIVLPLIKPALATFAVFGFMSSWNSFLWPLIVLRADGLKTLPVALASLQGQHATQWDVLMAGSVISILPMLALYVFAQKYVVQGATGSGLK